MTTAERIRALGIDRIPGWMVMDELVWLYGMGRWLAGTSGIYVEVGTYQGRSTCAVLAGLMDAGNGAERVACVDTFDGRGTSAPMDCRAALCRHADSRGLPLPWVLEEESMRAAERFREEALSAVFIDGAHDYASVAADLAAWAPKVAPGGMLCGHDYFESGVRRAVDERYGEQVRVAVRSIWTVRP